MLPGRLVAEQLLCLRQCRRKCSIDHVQVRTLSFCWYTQHCYALACVAQSHRRFSMVTSTSAAPAWFCVSDVRGVSANGSAMLACGEAMLTSVACCGAVRKGYKERMTKETQVSVALNIDGTGKCTANTPVHFLNHMLEVRRTCHHACSDEAHPSCARHASIPYWGCLHSVTIDHSPAMQCLLAPLLSSLHSQTGLMSPSMYAANMLARSARH